MPMQSAILKPGVDTEMTHALNEAGISESQLIRTKNNLTQTMGGWQAFGLGINIPSTVRDLHAWQTVTGVDFLAAAGTQNLVALTTSSYLDIIPQERDSYVLNGFSVSSGSNIVTIADPNSGLTATDTVEFHTPVSIGNLLLMGTYPVNTIGSTGSFTIISSVVSSTTIASSGILPIFTTTPGVALVTVEQPNNTVAAIQGLQQTFPHATSVGGLTITGPYNIFTVIDSTDYQIISPIAASAGATVTMSSGYAHLHYWITAAQLGFPFGYGGGGYGAGGYGIGVAVATNPGTPITATDWTLDNWGEVLIACQKDGPVFQWSPNIGFGNASIIPEAPNYNGGCFVSMPLQILVCWKSVQTQGNGGFNPGGTQDNLIVRWCDAQDFTNWTVSDQTAAGSFHIPTGSVIRGGLQGPTYGVIWTDIDVWIMQYTNDPVSIFNFTRQGSGCGLIGPHAAGVLGTDVIWCGESNIFGLSGSGVQAIPCTVWDFIFQGMNRAYSYKVCAAPNSAFGEMAFFFPYGDSTENNAYVKINTGDKAWDYGFLTRTAWQDISVVGNPVGTDTGSAVYQHEIGNMISGAGNSSFRSGWWAIADGEELAFVDWIMPDFTWGTYGNNDASIQITFFSADYPGDTPRSYGPYTITQANQYISPRIRGRLLSMQVQSATNNVFWRLGRIRYRYAPAGRR